MDAMLRAKLWEYFLRLVKTEDVTILITTHYIEVMWFMVLVHV